MTCDEWAEQSRNEPQVGQTAAAEEGYPWARETAKEIENHLDVGVVFETIFEVNNLWMFKRTVNLDFCIKLKERISRPLMKWMAQGKSEQPSWLNDTNKDWICTLIFTFLVFCQWDDYMATLHPNDCHSFQTPVQSRPEGNIIRKKVFANLDDSTTYFTKETSGIKLFF